MAICVVYTSLCRLLSCFCFHCPRSLTSFLKLLISFEIFLIFRLLLCSFLIKNVILGEVKIFYIGVFKGVKGSPSCGNIVEVPVFIQEPILQLRIVFFIRQGWFSQLVRVACSCIWSIDLNRISSDLIKKYFICSMWFDCAGWRNAARKVMSKSVWLSDSYPAFFLLIATTSNKNF